MTWENFTQLEEYLNVPQTCRVEIVRRDDGLYFFVQEALEMEEKPHLDEEYVTFWREKYRSGLYSSVEDARREAFASFDWISPKRQNDSHI